MRFVNQLSCNLVKSFNFNGGLKASEILLSHKCVSNIFILTIHTHIIPKVVKFYYYIYYIHYISIISTYIYLYLYLYLSIYRSIYMKLCLNNFNKIAKVNIRLLNDKI